MALDIGHAGGLSDTFPKSEAVAPLLGQTAAYGTARTRRPVKPVRHFDALRPGSGRSRPRMDRLIVLDRGLLILDRPTTNAEEVIGNGVEHGHPRLSLLHFQRMYTLR